jgi:hypothetical protein
MMKMSTFFAVSTAVACACSSAVMADIVWDESVDGSLSTDRFGTTDLGALSIGSNDVIGTTVSGISKFFTITIAEGTELSALIVEGWESADDIGFLGVVDGDWFDVDPANPDVPSCSVTPTMVNSTWDRTSFPPSVPDPVLRASRVRSDLAITVSGYVRAARMRQPGT